MCRSRGPRLRHAKRRRRASSGNAAFDAWRDAELSRLEAEARDFAAFIERLREAEDAAIFARFLRDRKRSAPVMLPYQPVLATLPADLTTADRG
jgi:hypothetical protein